MGSNLDTVERIHAAMIAADGSVLGDEKRRAELRALLEEVAIDDLECKMAARGGLQADRKGAGGFIAAWEDWKSPFEDVWIEVEDVIEVRPDCIVDFVRMQGRSSRGGAEVASEGGAAWFFEEGRLARVEFHLDREQLRKTAGLGPSA